MSTRPPEPPRRPTFAEQLAPLVAAIGDQPGAQHLGESLALAEGFHFYLAVCETPSVAAALKVWLEAEVPRRREEAINLVRLSPRPFDLWAPREPLDQERLVTSVLEPLFAMPHGGAGATVVLIDATTATKRERDIWLWLFQRLNERRNLLAQRVQAPVVLCLTPELEVDFIRAAPDLWSVRGLAVELRGPPPSWMPALAPFPGEEWSAPPEVSDREIEEARAAAASGQPAARQWLAILLSRRASSARIAGHLDKALRFLEGEVRPLWEQLGDERRQAETFLSIADIFYMRGEYTKALALIQERVLPVLRAGGEARSVAMAMGRVARILDASGKPDEAWSARIEELPFYEQRYAEARSPIEREQAFLGQADCLQGLGDLAFTRLDYAEATGKFEEALRRYEQAGDLLGQAQCLYGLGEVARVRSEIAEARRRLEQARDFYERVGALLGQANCLWSLAEIAKVLSEHEEATGQYQEALHLYERVGALRGQARCVCGLGDLARRRDNREEARKLYEEALRLFERAGDSLGQAISLYNLGEIALMRADLAGAKKRYEEALRLFERTDESVGQGMCLDRLGEIALLHTNYAEAKKRYEAASRLYARAGYSTGKAGSILGLGEVARRQSKGAEATQRFESALELYERTGSSVGQANSLTSLGHIAKDHLDLAKARTLYERALSLYERVGSLYGIMWAHRHLAAVAPDMQTRQRHLDAAREAEKRIDPRR